MKHWHIKHRTLGEQFVQTGDDQTPQDCGYSDAWVCNELAGEPGGFDRFENGELVEDQDLRAKSEKRAAMAGIGTDELISIIEDLTARIEQIETDGGIAARHAK